MCNSYNGDEVAVSTYLNCGTIPTSNAVSTHVANIVISTRHFVDVFGIKKSVDILLLLIVRIFKKFKNSTQTWWSRPSFCWGSPPSRQPPKASWLALVSGSIEQTRGNFSGSPFKNKIELIIARSPSSGNQANIQNADLSGCAKTPCTIVPGDLYTVTADIVEAGKDCNVMRRCRPWCHVEGLHNCWISLPQFRIIPVQRRRLRIFAGAEMANGGFGYRFISLICAQTRPLQPWKLEKGEDGCYDIGWLKQVHFLF